MRTGAIYKKVNSTYTTSELQSNGTIKGMPIGVLFEHQGKTYKLVHANGSISANRAVKYDPTATTYGILGASVIQTAAATDAPGAGIAETAITSGDFGWITVAGVANCLLSGTPAVGAALSASGTSGALQTAPFTAATVQCVFGVNVGTAAGGTQPVLLQGRI